MPWKIIVTPVDGAIRVTIDADSDADYQEAYTAWTRLTASALDSTVADSVVVRLQLVNGAPTDGIYTLRELGAFVTDSSVMVNRLTE